MNEMKAIWTSIRGTVGVVAQVFTLGAVALVLCLVALNLFLQRAPSASDVPPSRPLVAVVPTVIAEATRRSAIENEDDRATPTQLPLAVLYQPPGLLTPTPVEPRPSAEVPLPPLAAAPTGTPVPSAQALPNPQSVPAPATSTPRPPATATARPAAAPTRSPTAIATATATRARVLPGADTLPVRVRSAPSVNAPIVGRIPLGTIVDILGSVKGDEVESGNATWLRIRWNSISGFVYSPLVG